MKVNIYEYGKKYRWKIDYLCRVNDHDIENDYSVFRFVKSMECPDVKLNVGDFIDEEYEIIKAVIIENGYNVYVYNFTGKLVCTNLEGKQKLE